jgi:topoisomerase-4 subunit A
LRLTILASTTDKLVIFANNGRFYTLSGDKLPRGRGHGEPLRLMIDMANEAEILVMLVHKPGRKLLLVSNVGNGFIVEENEVIAQTRSGKQVMNLGDGETATHCLAVEGDGVATVGENRRMLVFKAEEIPTMTRGRGVILQRFKDGGLSDVRFFNFAEGLSWKSGERVRSEPDLTEWTGKRASAGRLAPNGFPRGNKF